MATTCKYPILLLACWLILVPTRAEGEAEEFKKLKDEIFGVSYDEFHYQSLETNYQRLLELLESGKITAEVQGQITLDHLNSLVTAFGVKKTCNLVEQMAEADHLKNRTAGTPPEYLFDLRKYTDRAFENCAGVVYRDASRKLSSLTEEQWIAVRKIATEAEEEMKPKIFRGHLFRPCREEAQLNYNQIVHKVLKDLDPDGFEKKSMKKFIDKIRVSCSTFLENLDSRVGLYQSLNYVTLSSEPMDRLMLWRFYKNNCEQVLNQWKDIISKSNNQATDHKPELTKCSSSYGSGDDGTGFSSGGLIEVF